MTIVTAKNDLWSDHDIEQNQHQTTLTTEMEIWAKYSVEYQVTLDSYVFKTYESTSAGFDLLFNYNNTATTLWYSPK